MNIISPITRKEIYLNAICDNTSDNIPSPITREEEYLYSLAKGIEGSVLSPITRQENYYTTLLNRGKSELEPVNRKEIYWFNICNNTIDETIKPVTREEIYLDYIMKNNHFFNEVIILEVKDKTLDKNGAYTSAKTGFEGNTNYKITLNIKENTLEKGNGEGYVAVALENIKTTVFTENSTYRIKKGQTGKVEWIGTTVADISAKTSGVNLRAFGVNTSGQITFDMKVVKA